MLILEKVKCGMCEEVWLENRETGEFKQPGQGTYDGCGEFVDSIGDSAFFTTNDDSAWICPYCSESLQTEPLATMIVAFPDDGKAKIAFDSGFGIDFGHFDSEYVEIGELPDNLQDAVENIVKLSYWKKTDAWRGYFQPEIGESPANFVEIIDTWHSSMESSGFSERVNNLVANAPFPIIAVFSRTSNVCALGVTLYVESTNVEEAVGALGEIEHY